MPVHHVCRPPYTIYKDRIIGCLYVIVEFLGQPNSSSNSSSGKPHGISLRPAVVHTRGPGVRYGPPEPSSRSAFRVMYTHSNNIQKNMSRLELTFESKHPTYRLPLQDSILSLFTAASHSYQSRLLDLAICTYMPSILQYILKAPAHRLLQRYVLSLEI